jgi:hypothetical protein
MGKKRKIISHPQFWKKYANHPAVKARQTEEQPVEEKVVSQPKPEPKKADVKPAPKPAVVKPIPKPAPKLAVKKPAPKKVRSWIKNKK